jgi:hypothetical protein
MFSSLYQKNGRDGMEVGRGMSKVGWDWSEQRNRKGKGKRTIEQLNN